MSVEDYAFAEEENMLTELTSIKEETWQKEYSINKDMEPQPQLLMTERQKRILEELERKYQQKNEEEKSRNKRPNRTDDFLLSR